MSLRVCRPAPTSSLHPRSGSCQALAVVLLASSSAASPLGLPTLVERARANDGRVREAQAQLRWLRAKAEEARWAWFPRFDTYVAVGGPTPEARNDGLGGPPLTRATLMYDLDFGEPGIMLRAGVDAVLPIYTFGKLRALESAGEEAVRAGHALADRAKDEAELQTSQAYYGYCLASAGLRVLDDTARRLDEAKATLERLRAQRSTQVSALDPHKLEFFRRQLAVQREAAERGRALALAALRLLVGAAEEEEPLEVEVLPLPVPEGQLAGLDALLAAAASSRPELRAVEAGIAARQSEVRLRERMYYPDFGLAGFARWAYTTNATRQRSPFAFDPYHDATAGVGLVMRYQWDLPMKDVLLEQARAELEKIQRQGELLRAAVRFEIEREHGAVTEAMARVVEHTAAEKSARRWATSAVAAFELGTGETRDLLEGFSALASASASRAQALHDVQVALRGLSRAVGRRVQLQGPSAAPPR